MALSHSTRTVTEECSRTDSWPSLMILRTNWSAVSGVLESPEACEMRPHVSISCRTLSGCSRPDTILAFASTKDSSISLLIRLFFPTTPLFKDRVMSL